MPRPSISVTTTVEQTIKMSTKAKQMLLTRAREHAALADQEKEIKRRKKAIEGEVDALFVKEGQGAALADGTKVDGIAFKLVTGDSPDFDKLGFMKAHGLTEADFEEFTTRKPKTPYVRITLPKKGKGDDE